jgi:DNA-directed RNA polymerase specialized sigma24 family protein
VRLRDQLSHFPRALERVRTAVGTSRSTASALLPGEPEGSGPAVEKSEGSKPAALYRPHTKLRPAQIQTLIEQYEAGVSIKQLSREFNLHEQTARAHVERAGVGLRPQRVADAERVAEIVQLYEAGLSLREVSAELRLTYGSVRNYLLRAGVDLRPPVRRPSPGQTTPDPATGECLRALLLTEYSNSGGSARNDGDQGDEGSEYHEHQGW